MMSVISNSLNTSLNVVFGWHSTEYIGFRLNGMNGRMFDKFKLILYGCLDDANEGVKFNNDKLVIL